MTVGSPIAGFAAQHQKPQSERRRKELQLSRRLYFDVFWSPPRVLTYLRRSQFSMSNSPSLHGCREGSIFRSEPEESSQGHVAGRQRLSWFQVWKNGNKCVDYIIWYYMSWLYTHVRDTIMSCKQKWSDPDLTLQDFPPLNVLPATCLGNVPVHRSQGADAKEDDCSQLVLDKMPAPELRLLSSRSSSREPRFVDRSPRKWPAAPSGECRARSPWFRRHPIRSHLFFPTVTVALQQRSVAKVCLQTKGRLASNPWTFDEKIQNIDWKHWEFTDSPDSRWEKGWNLYEWIRMNMKLRLMTLSRPQTWRGLQVGQEPGYRKSQDFECCFQLQTLSALQVTLNLWLLHMMTQYPFVQWNSNKTTFIPMAGWVTNVTWSVTPACSSGCPSSSTSS